MINSEGPHGEVYRYKRRWLICSDPTLLHLLITRNRPVIWGCYRMIEVTRPV